MKILIVFLALVSSSMAAINVLPQNKRYSYQQKESTIKNTTSKSKRDDGKILKLIEKQNAELKALIPQKSNLPLISDNSIEFVTGTVIKGMMLNSVVSTNLESPILVAPTDGERLSKDARFSCIGTTKHKRVIAACNLLIKDGREFEIEAEVLNLDGSSGIRGEYYEGQEGYIAGMLASEIAKGLIGVSQAKLNLKNDAAGIVTAKNQLINGLLDGGALGTETLKSQMNTTEPVVFINAGKEVLIYFKRRFTSEEKN